MGVRIDKFLWSVRLFKTRSKATAACRNGQVVVGNHPVKASYEINVGDEIEINRRPVRYSYRVKQLLSKRVGAKLVDNYIDDITPAEEIEKQNEIKKTPAFYRDRGTGRPTKKERRELDKLINK